MTLILAVRFYIIIRYIVYAWHSFYTFILFFLFCKSFNGFYTLSNFPLQLLQVCECCADNIFLYSLILSRRCPTKCLLVQSQQQKHKKNVQSGFKENKRHHWRSDRCNIVENAKILNYCKVILNSF